MSVLASELKRKAVHIAMGGFALALRRLTPLEAAGCALIALVFNLFVLHRLTRRALLRHEERDRGFSLGIAMYPAAVLGLILVFHRRLELAAAAWAFLAFGDEARDREDALATIRAERSRSRFKQELISGFPAGETVSSYRQGEFTDLCRGPHLPSTGRLGAFKILSIAGAYWRGASKREMLQRINATAFFSKDELKEHLRRLDEAEKRDHRRLGVQLDLFRFLPEAPGFPLWMPNGTIVFNELVAEMRRKLSRRGYLEARTPHIMYADLWKRSGHWDARTGAFTSVNIAI